MMGSIKRQGSVFLFFYCKGLIKLHTVTIMDPSSLFGSVPRHEIIDPVVIKPKSELQIPTLQITRASWLGELTTYIVVPTNKQGPAKIGVS